MACSSSDSDSDGSGSGGTLTTSDLSGTWLSSCQTDTSSNPPTSASMLVEIAASTINLTITGYLSTDCTGASTTVGTETLTYTLGGSCTLDGTVAGITSGTALDTTTGTNTLDDPVGEKLYDCIAVSGSNLYISDDEADPAKDASSPDKRPTRLDDNPFVKQ